MSKTIYAQTSARMLKEIPRFFGGFQSALSEIFQNAYRAGAKNVIVKHDNEKRLLVISDDGPGLSDPQKLITAGETGWNENNIVEPAGLGAFSILRDEFVEKVEYISQGAGNWTMTLTPEVLAGKPIEVTDLPNPDGRKGLTAILHLSENQEVTEKMVQEARAQYPYSVTLMDDEGIKNIEPYKGFDPLISIPTPVGKIDWATCSHSDQSKTVVWEHRNLHSLAFMDALYRAIKNSAHPELAEEIFSRCRFSWTIDVSSGVRAKLPDRNDLIAGETLENAARQIVDELTNRIIADTKNASALFPEKISGGYHYSNDELKETGIKWLDEILHGNHTHPNLFHQCLTASGWAEIKYGNVEELDVHDNGEDGFDVDGSLTWEFYRKPQFTVGSGFLAFTLNNLGHPTLYRYDAPNPKVEVKGLRLSPQINITGWGNSSYKDYASPWILLADEITVEGVGKVPYLLKEYWPYSEESFGELVGDKSIDNMDKLSIIFAGTPAECIAAINNDYMIRHLIAVNCNHDGWDQEWECDYYGDRDVDWDKISSDLEVQVMKAFAPSVAEKREYMYILDNCETQMTEIIQSINSLKSKLLFSAKDDKSLSLDSAFSALDSTASQIDRDLSRRVATLRRETELT